MIADNMSKWEGIAESFNSMPISALNELMGILEQEVESRRKQFEQKTQTNSSTASLQLVK